MAMTVGYARCSTLDQDLTAQREALALLGVKADRIYTDHGESGGKRDRPGLDLALAACHSGDTLAVTKLDRLGRSVPDLREIADRLTAGEIKLSINGSVYDPTDPVGKMMFTALSMIAEFELDMIRQRTREGMAIASAAGRLKGRRPTLTDAQDRHVRKMFDAGSPVTEIADLMSRSRQVIYRSLERTGGLTADA